MSRARRGTTGTVRAAFPATTGRGPGSMFPATLVAIAEGANVHQPVPYHTCDCRHHALLGSAEYHMRVRVGTYTYIGRINP